MRTSTTSACTNTPACSTSSPRPRAPTPGSIPSAGPDFGKLIDQASVLRARAFPTAMVLPQAFPATSDGAENGIRRFADAFGRKVIVYVKAENFLPPEAVGRLVDSGIVRRSSMRSCAPTRMSMRYLANSSTRGPEADRERHRRAPGDRPPARLGPHGLYLRLGVRGAARLHGAAGGAEGETMPRRKRYGGVPSARGPARQPEPDPRVARGSVAGRHRSHGPDPAAAFQPRTASTTRHWRRSPSNCSHTTARSPSARSRPDPVEPGTATPYGPSR